jgi:hypothetical protein
MNRSRSGSTFPTFRSTFSIKLLTASDDKTFFQR